MSLALRPWSVLSLRCSCRDRVNISSKDSKPKSFWTSKARVRSLPLLLQLVTHRIRPSSYHHVSYSVRKSHQILSNLSSNSARQANSRHQAPTLIFRASNSSSSVPDYATWKICNEKSISLTPKALHQWTAVKCRCQVLVTSLSEVRLYL